MTLLGFVWFLTIVFGFCCLGSVIFVAFRWWATR